MKCVFGTWFVVVAAALVVAGCPGFTGPADAPFVPVSAIANVPEAATAGQDLALTGTVDPAGATNRAIDWSVRSDGATGAEISGSTLRTVAPGTVVVTATVVNGLGASSDYTKDFTITVRQSLPGAIAVAKVAKTGVAVSADGSDVAQDGYWVSQTALDALNTAIGAAETTARDNAADQDGVDVTTAALTAATNTFNAAKQQGTAATNAAVNKTALAATIVGANDAKSGVVVSAEGSDISPNAHWAPRAAFDALNAAIGAAETTAQDNAADQDGVDVATAALTAATNTFNAAKQQGSKAPADKTALAAAIGAAGVAQTGVAVSADGSDVSIDLFWVTEAVLGALNTAINAAETTALDGAADQAGVNAATAALTAATNSFKGAARKGVKPVRTVSVNGVSFDLCYVNPPGPGGFKYDQAITHIATISKGYWVGETEVTQDLFRAVMGVNPSYFGSFPPSGEAQGKRPVEQVNWYAAIAFCNKLSLLDGKTPVYSVTVGGAEVDWANLAYDQIPPGTLEQAWHNAQEQKGNGYRLPYEMEWMWAAMGGSQGGERVTDTGHEKPFAGSDGTNSIGDYAWHNGNAEGKTHEVGKKLPNELGLYDMTGNVAEWCSELEGRTVFARHASPAPARMFRGGGWHIATAYYAVGYRGEEAHDLPVRQFHYVGFRVVCDQ